MTRSGNYVRALSRDREPEFLADRRAGMSRADLCTKYGLNINTLKGIVRRLGVQLSSEDRSRALAAAGRKSYQTRVRNGTLRFGDINSPEAIQKRAATRRVREANRVGFVDLEARCRAWAASRKGSVTGAVSYLEPATWTCSQGHDWKAIPKNVLINETWCPNCAHVGPSAAQLELRDYIQSLVPGEEVRVGDRQVIGPLELDIYVPSRNFGLEYNGLIFHSDYFGSKRGRHQTKALRCREAGVKLLAVFEDEWRDNRELVEAMIRHRLGVSSGLKLRASKLEVRFLDRNRDFSAFFDRFHLDGQARASWAVGLFLGPDLLACLSIRSNFKKETEICRFAVDYRYRIPGAAGRLLKAARTRIPGPLVTFSNNRLSEGNVYQVLGFDLVAENPSSYWYTDGQTRVWRFRCRRNNDPGVRDRFPTEAEQARGGVFSPGIFGDDRALYRVEDYGHRKWVLTTGFRE